MKEASMPRLTRNLAHSGLVAGKSRRGVSCEAFVRSASATFRRRNHRLGEAVALSETAGTKGVRDSEALLRDSVARGTGDAI